MAKAFAAAQAPEVEFNKYYYSNVKPDGTSQTQANSGEDWFYDFTPSFEDGRQIGYMCVGYSTYPSFGFNDGCSNNTTPSYSLDLFDIPPVNQINSPARDHGDASAKAAFIDMNGNSLWYKNYGTVHQGNNTYYPTGGRFYKVVQIDEEHYLAVGRIRNYKEYFNPTPNSPNGITFNCSGNYENVQAYAVIMDEYGEVEFGNEFCYTFLDYPEDLTREFGAFLDIVPYGNNFILIGYSKFDDGTENKYRPFLCLVNSLGQVISKNRISPSSFLGYDVRTFSGVLHTNGLLYITGDRTNASSKDAALIAIDPATLNIANGTIPKFYDHNSSMDDASTCIREDLVSHKLIWPVVRDGSGIGGEVIYRGGEGIVFLLDPSAIDYSNQMFSSSMNGISVSQVYAYDLRINVTPLSNGGFALVTTKKDPAYLTPPYVPTSTNIVSPPHNYGEQEFWHTDPYVAVFDLNGNLSWDKSIKESTPPGITSDPQGQIIVGDPRLQGDIKRQECFYAINADADGKLVLCGNCSNNLDDDALIRLYTNCQQQRIATLNPNYDITPSNHIWNVTTNTTWGGSKVVNAEVHVKNNSTLTIAYGATFEFPNSREVGYPVRIIVEPGSKLILTNGATLKGLKTCGEHESMWDGVQVWGTPTLPQTAANQGTVQITANGTIKNAYNALVADNMYYGGTTYSGGQQIIDYSQGQIMSNLKTGGIVQLDGINIVDCRNGVSFMQYPQYTPSNQIGYDNASYIRNSNFLSNNPLPGQTDGEGRELGTDAFISAWDVHGVEVRTNTFSSGLNFDEDDENRQPTGIGSIDADFSIISTCTLMGQNGCVQSLPNNFTNLRRGVFCEYTSAIYQRFLLKIDDNIFTNCYGGTTVRNAMADSKLSITRNKHFLEDHTNVFGIWLEGCSGKFTVTENHVNSNFPFYTYGIVNRAGGSTYNRVYKNYLNNLGFGLQAQLTNGSGVNNGSGLEYNCNQLTYNTMDITLLQSGILRYQQGDFTGRGAYNTFDKFCGGGSQCNFFVENSSNSLFYVIPFTELVGAPGYTPDYRTQSKVTLMNLNLLPGSIIYDQVCRTILGTNVGGNGGGLASMQTRNEEMEQIMSIIDGGDKEQMLAYIDNNSISSSQLKDIIFDSDAYLTDSVMKSIISRPDPLTYNDLRDVVISQSPLKEEVYEYLDSTRPAVAINYDVMVAQDGVAPIEILTGELSALRDANAEDYGLLLMHYYDEGLEDSANYIIGLYGSKQEHFNRAVLSGDFVAAQTFVDAMPEGKHDDDVSKQLRQLELNLLENGMSWSELNESQLEWLKEIANEDVLTSAGQAKAILHLLNGTRYPEILLDIDETQSERIATNEKLKHTPIKNNTFVECLPNPSSGNFHVSIQDGEWIENAMTLNVFSTLGIMVYTKQLEAGSKISTVDLTGLSNGAYYVEVRQDMHRLGGNHILIIR